jgi:hypothetical protein
MYFKNEITHRSSRRHEHPPPTPHHAMPMATTAEDGESMVALPVEGEEDTPVTAEPITPTADMDAKTPTTRKRPPALQLELVVPAMVKTNRLGCVRSTGFKKTLKKSSKKESSKTEGAGFSYEFFLQVSGAMMYPEGS